MNLAIGEQLVRGTTTERLHMVQELGADGIELVFGPHAHEQHLLWKAAGPAELRAAAQAADIELASVFAGYFHEHPLSHPEPGTRRLNVMVLDRLLDACAEAGIPVLVLPLLGAADLGAVDAANRLIESLGPIVPKVQARELTIAFELPRPLHFLSELRAGLPDSFVRIAYDLGQAATIGADPIVDLTLLGESVVQLRVRDVRRDGSRVALGQGIVDFAALARKPFAGWWTLEGSPTHDRGAAVSSEIRFLRSVA